MNTEKALSVAGLIERGISMVIQLSLNDMGKLEHYTLKKHFRDERWWSKHNDGVKCLAPEGISNAGDKMVTGGVATAATG